MPKSPFFQSQKEFDEAQAKLGVEPLASPNKNSSSHTKSKPGYTPAQMAAKRKAQRDWQETWLDINDEVQRSRKDAEEADRNKKKQQLYQKFPNKSPKAT